MKPNYQSNQTKPYSGAPGAYRRSGSSRGGRGRGGRSRGGRPPWHKDPPPSRFNKPKPKSSSSSGKGSTGSDKPLHGITLMVALSEYPKQVMTDEQLTGLEDEILESIDQIKDAIRPQFLDCKRDTGALLIRCNNALTANWLKEVVPQLNIWAEAKLKVVDSITTTKEISKLIVPSKYPLAFLTMEQLNKLYADILKEIDKIPTGSFMPQFLNCSKERGALNFQCNNIPSAEWLRTTVPFLEDWKDSDIVIMDPIDVPQRSTLQLWIPGPAEEPDQVLERLERQNKGLKASEWILLNRKLDDSGQKLFVTVDDSVLSELKKVDYNPFLNFTRVKIKRLGRYKPKEPKATDDKVEDPDTAYVDPKDESQQSADQTADADDINDISDVFTAIDELVEDIDETLSGQ